MDTQRLASWLAASLLAPWLLVRISAVPSNEREAAGATPARDGFADAATTSDRYTTLLPPGAVAAGARAINNRGQVFGAYGDGFQEPRRFVYADGAYTSIDVPGAFTSPQDINLRGDIVGWSIPSGGSQQGFLYRDGSFAAVNPPGAVQSVASGINDRGEIAGSYLDAMFRGHGFLYRNGAYTTIAPPGALYVYFTRMNSKGQIVGSYYHVSGRQMGFCILTACTRTCFRQAQIGRLETRSTTKPRSPAPTATSAASAVSGMTRASTLR